MNTVHSGKTIFNKLRAVGLALALTLALAGCSAKPVKVDPTAYLTVEFAGISGEGTASWKFDSDSFAAACDDSVKDAEGLASCVDGSFDMAEGLSNGDTVTFHWNCDTDTAEREYNAILSPADTTFMVEGLDEWVTALDQIGQEDWDSLVADGKAALSQREGDCITGADCLGGYTLVRQDFSSEMVETHNILYVAYKVQAQLPDGSSLTYYAGIGFSDLVLHGDGSVDVTGDRGFAAYGNIDVLVNGEYYNFTGFETLEDMNAECIDGYEGMYSVESGVADA